MLMCPMSPEHKHRYNTKLILTAKVYLALRDHLLLSTPEQCLRDGAWWHEQQESWAKSTLFFSTELMGMKLLTVENREEEEPCFSRGNFSQKNQLMSHAVIVLKVCLTHKTVALFQFYSRFPQCAYWVK